MALGTVSVRSGRAGREGIPNSGAAGRLSFPVQFSYERTTNFLILQTRWSLTPIPRRLTRVKSEYRLRSWIWSSQKPPAARDPSSLVICYPETASKTEIPVDESRRCAQKSVRSEERRVGKECRS